MTKLTLEQVKVAARHAYNQRQLLAQHPKIRGYFYRKIGSGLGCAIGVALSDKHIRELESTGHSQGGNLKFNKELMRNWFNLKDFSELVEIQRTHDDWGIAARYAHSAELEKLFLEKIDHPKAKEL